MTSEHIAKLIAEGESLTVEFKECVNELNNSLFETVCSFSNRYGGHLLLGVKDDGGIIGVNPSAVPHMKKNFANMLNNPQKTSPSLFLSLEEAKLDGKLLLHVYVPVSSQIQSCSGRIYDRNEDGDFDITNSTDLVAHLSVRKSNHFTEREVFPYAKEEHLLLDKLMPMVRNMAVGRRPKHPWKTMSNMEIIKSAGLYDEDIRTGRQGFNRAAILLFGREEIIQQAAPGYVTDCLLRVKNTDRYDDRLRVETNLIESFDIIMDFIAKHTNDPFFLIDNRNISVRDNISKEIVSNILVHREFSGTFPARVIIEKDRLVAENWNRALRHGRIDINNFEPYPKNPILARFFVNIGNADTLGSGVRNLVKYTKLYSGGEPELIEGDIFKTIIPLAMTSGKQAASERQTSGKQAASKRITSEKQANNERITSGKQANNERIRANSTSEKKRIILEYLEKHGQASVVDFAEEFKLSKGRVRAILLEMTEENLIEKMGKTKSAYYVRSVQGG
jgi:ATP-dependent DNA helicase RecG